MPDVTITKRDVTVLKLNVTVSKLDVTPIKLNVTVSKLDVTPIKLDVTPMKLDVTPMKLDVTPIKLDVTPMKLDVTPIKLDVTPMKLNVTVPGPGSQCTPLYPPGVLRQPACVHPKKIQKFPRPLKGKKRGILTHELPGAFQNQALTF